MLMVALTVLALIARVASDTLEARMASRYHAKELAAEYKRMEEERRARLDTQIEIEKIRKSYTDDR